MIVKTVQMCGEIFLNFFCFYFGASCAEVKKIDDNNTCNGIIYNLDILLKYSIIRITVMVIHPTLKGF